MIHADVELDHAAVDGTADAVHDRDPRRRSRAIPRRAKHEQQHGCAEHAEPVLEPAADQLAQDAARGLARIARVEMRRRGRARRDREQEARTAPEHRPALGQIRLRNRNTPAISTSTGNRYAVSPTRRNATSANQAPAGPIRFATLPSPPATLNAGSTGL